MDKKKLLLLVTLLLLAVIAIALFATSYALMTAVIVLVTVLLLVFRGDTTLDFLTIAIICLMIQVAGGAIYNWTNNAILTFWILFLGFTFVTIVGCALQYFKDEREIFSEDI